jgi:hypothetical protein
MGKHTLVFSIALNGYQHLYRKELASQKRYAVRLGYDYQAITRPFFSPLGVECCWLKLTLMREALMSGYQNVMFVDADAEIKSNCPPLEKLFIDDKFVFMAKGRTKRFNSGVLITRNHALVLDWLTNIINSQNITVLQQNNVGWGENGHVIELSKDCPFISEIDLKWNNTYNHDLTDYIRHKNCGVLRDSVVTNVVHRIIFCLSHRILLLKNKFTTPTIHNSSDKTLENETEKISKIYPSFIIN